MGEAVVEMAQGDASYPALARQAQFAQKTMIQRYNAAQWVYALGSGLWRRPIPLRWPQRYSVLAVQTSCKDGDCNAARADLLAAFSEVTDELDRATLSAPCRSGAISNPM